MNIINQIYIQEDISFINRGIEKNIEFLQNDNVVYQLIKNSISYINAECSNKINQLRVQNDRYVTLLDKIDAVIKTKTEKACIKILNKRRTALIKGYEHNRKLLDGNVEVYKYIHSKLSKEEELPNTIKMVKSFISSIYEKLINVGYGFNFGSVFFKELIHYLFTNRKNQDDAIFNHLSQNTNHYFLNSLPLIRDKKEVEPTHLKFNPSLFDGLQERIDILFKESMNEDDSDFDYFFILELRHTELSEINNFLNYHARQFDSPFIEFLDNALANFDDLLVEKQINKAKRWLEDNKGKNLKTIAIKRPNIKQRSKDDTLTTLTNDQTALLFHYLKRSSVILKDKTLQTDLEIAKGISIMTGYSENSLRQGLSKAKKTDEINKEDLFVTQKKLKEIIRLITSDLEQL